MLKNKFVCSRKNAKSKVIAKQIMKHITGFQTPLSIYLQILYLLDIDQGLLSQKQL